MSKINISYLNIAAQSPSLELNFSLSEKIHRETSNSKHVFFMCNKALTSCSINVFNKRSICSICKHKAKKGFKIFKERNPNSELVKISRKNIINNSKVSNINNEIDKELLFGVHSTISSILRLDNMELLDKRWKKIKKKMHESSIGLYYYFDKFLKNTKVNNFIIFNGRVSCARPLIEVSKNNNVNFNLFDAKNNGKIPYLSFNEMFHSINFEKKHALKLYVKFFKESKSIAEEYIFKKQNAIRTNDPAFTENQEIGHIDKEILNLKKPLISIFVSSDDEYRFIGSDWAEFGLPDQIESINKMVNSPLSKKYDFVVKMHPNQISMHSSIKNKYVELSKTVNVLLPENKTDTYSLIMHSEIILNFCSTVGAEANYLRKPVVQIGASRFRLLPVANYVSSPEEAIEVIHEKKFKLMPKRASVVYFCFQAKTPFKLASYKWIEDGVFTYANKHIVAPMILRLLAAPDKLFTHIIKGDKEIYSNSFMYAKNLIFGTTKVKR